MTAPWTRSDATELGLGRALVATREDGARACLSTFGAVWVLSDPRGLGQVLETEQLGDRLADGGWGDPSPEDVAWLRGGA